MATARHVTETFAGDTDSTWYRAMESFWHPVAYAADVRCGKPVGCWLLGRRIVLAELGGAVRAFDDICRHRGASIALGWIENDCVSCPYHGWQYDSTGAVARIPSRPELTGQVKARLRSYHCRESAGMIWVALADDPFGEPPTIPEWDEPEVRWQSPDYYDWATSAPRRLENFIDFSHFPFVHENILGTRDKPEIDMTEVTRAGHVLRFSRTAVEPNDKTMKTMLGIDTDTVEVENQYLLTMPATIYLIRNFPNGGRYMLFMASCPTGPSTSRNFWHIGSDFAKTDADDKHLLDFELLVLEQDQPVVESQLPEHLPSELSAEMHVKVADNVTMNYRLWLLRLADELTTVDVAR